MTTINDMIKEGKVKVNPANPFEISYDSDLLITKEAYDEYTKNVWEEDPDAYKHRKQGESDIEYQNRMLGKNNSHLKQDDFNISNFIQDTMIEKLKEKNNTATIESVCDALKEFLLAKNKNYGNSATEPVRIFSKSNANEGILVRMDDKLSRIKNSDSLRSNDLVDLCGYLVLLLKNNGWDNFMDMVD